MLGLMPWLCRGLRDGAAGQTVRSGEPAAAKSRAYAARNALVCIIKPLLEPRVGGEGGAGQTVWTGEPPAAMSRNLWIAQAQRRGSC